MKCEDHILSLQFSTDTKTQLLRPRISHPVLKTVTDTQFVCICVCLCARHRMIKENVLWHVEGQRTQHWIILVAPHIRFCCFLLLFFVFVHVTTHNSYLRPFSPPCYYGLSFSWSIDVIWATDVGRKDEEKRESERKRKREWVVDFLWVCECRSIICFLEGVVVQRQPAGEPCLLYLIRTDSVTPWL